MSGPSTPSAEPVEDTNALVRYLEGGCKAPEAWRIGTEHEKFVFERDGLRRPAYSGPSGIGALMHELAEVGGYKRVFEGDSLVALTCKDRGSVTYEPGGQLELSGAALETLHETCGEVNGHLADAKRVGDKLGVGFIGAGFDPKWTRAETPWMPKQRYRLMREYMPTRGNLGLDMMIRTSTVQVNLDFASEADMLLKMRTSLAMQPVVTAMFANSPFKEGKPNGFLSYRSHVWTDTDPDRCGMTSFFFEDGAGFERYVDYVLDVPMYFVYRDGTYLDARGQSFRDFLAGRLPALPGEKPTIGDWADHLTTLFPEVRLKQFIEQRGADSGPWRQICALPAVWVGLLYDADCLAEAWALVSGWGDADRETLRREVPKRGLLAATPDGRTVADLAEQVLAISRRGLRRRARMDSRGANEEHFLDGLDKIVSERESPARRALRLFESDWQGSVDPMYKELAY